MLLELAKKGVSREQAYEWVQRNAMQSFEERRDFKALLEADGDVSAVLTPAEIERAFDLDGQFQHVDEIFDRVFVTEPAPQGCACGSRGAGVVGVTACGVARGRGPANGARQTGAGAPE